MSLLYRQLKVICIPINVEFPPNNCTIYLLNKKYHLIIGAFAIIFFLFAQLSQKKIHIQPINFLGPRHFPLPAWVTSGIGGAATNSPTFSGHYSPISTANI